MTYDADDMLKQLFKRAIAGNRFYGYRATEAMLDRTIMTGFVKNKSMEKALNILSKAGFISGQSLGNGQVAVRLTKKGYREQFTRTVK